VDSPDDNSFEPATEPLTQAAPEPPTDVPTEAEASPSGSTSTEETQLEEAVPVRGSRPRLLVGLALVVALVAGALIFTLTRSSGIALALALPSGQKIDYHMSMTIHGSIAVGGQQQALDETIVSDSTWNVLSVDSAGVATVEVSSSNMSVNLGGQTVPVDKPVSMRMRIAPDGRILSGGDFGSAAGGSAGATIPGGSQFTPLLPDHKVGPGDTWQRSFDQQIPILGGTLHYSTSNRFLRYETVGGRRTAVIQSTMSVPMKLRTEVVKLLELSGITPADAGLPAGSNPIIGYDGNVSITGTYWLDPDHGALIKASLAEKPNLTLTFTGFPSRQIAPGTTATFTGNATVNIDPR
jgi:hypothetical protein